MKIKTTFTREGVIFIFVASVFMVGAIVREVNPMLLLSAALFAIIPISLWLGRYSLRGMVVGRRLPERVFVGESFTVYVVLSKSGENSGNNESNIVRESVSFGRRLRRKGSRGWRFSGSWGIVVSDKIQSVSGELFGEESGDNDLSYEPAVYFEYVERGGVIRKSYAGKLSRRGLYKFGSMSISTRFPFGFCRHSMSLADGAGVGGEEFYVFPKIGHLLSKWQTRRTEAAINRQRYKFRPSRGTGEFLGVRRWLPGDTRKWIHWRASARHGQPFVRQFEVKQNYDCAVLLDIYDDSFGVGSGQIDEGNFELALSFAATLVNEMMRRGGCNLFFATSNPNEEYLSGPICLPLVESVLRRLAITKREFKDNLPKVITEMLPQIDNSSDIILISPKPINLELSQRFNSTRNDPRFRNATQRIKTIDTSNPDFDQYFSL
ncbi:MAG: DUF58 domain-containing protein [Planctomycetaceae bacterium]|jgi:uncharacterized protein (DUF58 family)|nr:DUF58 domain-containing protein [Planctomycetaceae bacterium]